MMYIQRKRKGGFDISAVLTGSGWHDYNIQEGTQFQFSWEDYYILLKIITKATNVDGCDGTDAKEEGNDVVEKVPIPDSCLRFTGYCEEQIELVFPKASEDDIKKVIDRFSEKFSRKEGEFALKWISGLKDDIWRLRRSFTHYPEFREHVEEGLPLPKGFQGFNVEESKQVAGVIASLLTAYTRLRDYYHQSNLNEAGGIKPGQPMRAEAFSIEGQASASEPLSSSVCAGTGSAQTAAASSIKGQATASEPLSSSACAVTGSAQTAVASSIEGQAAASEPQSRR